ncbi:MAG TPA: phage holin family protein [Microbacteriaceae bacterium]|nr:phage holin family protein [Microbacteriaceae bacterium]
MTDTGPKPAHARRSFAELLADIPRLLGELVRAEIDALKAELAKSAQRAALGVGLLVGAFVILLLAIVTLVWAAVAALALVLPMWAAALIVAGVLLIIAALIGWLGVLRLRTAGPDLESRAESITDDIRAIKGEAPRETTVGDTDG